MITVNCFDDFNKSMHSFITEHFSGKFVFMIKHFSFNIFKYFSTYPKGFLRKLYKLSKNLLDMLEKVFDHLHSFIKLTVHII